MPRMGKRGESMKLIPILRSLAMPLAAALSRLAADACPVDASAPPALVEVRSTGVFPLLSVAVADLNHDELPDAFTVPVAPFLRTGFGSIWAFPIHLGRGDGLLSSSNSVTTGLLPDDLVPLKPVVGDFNGDGRADIGVVFYDTCAGHVADPNPNCLTPSQSFLAVLLGQADGSLAWMPTRPIGSFGGAPGGYFMNDCAAADLNHDGRTDLIFPASVLLSRGDGTFGDMLPLPAGSLLGETLRIGIGDCTGDGTPDVVKAVRRFDPIGAEVGELQIYPGRGNGSFSEPTVAALPYVNTSDLSVADMDGDGTDDVVCLNHPHGLPGDVRVIFGRTFASTGLPLSNTAGGDRLGLIDLNDDGAPEVVVQAWGIRGDEVWRSVFRNDGKGVLTAPELQFLGASGSDGGGGDLATGDLNADGRRDLIAVSDGAPYISAALNRPPDVTLAIDGDKAISAGSITAFTVAVRNVGRGSTLPAGVRVEVAGPDQLKFISGTGTGWICTEDAGRVTCNGPRLAAEGESVLTLRFQVGIEYSTGIRFAANVTTPGEANLANNSATFAASFLGYDLSLAMTRPSPGSLVVGVPSSYELILRNTGDLPIDPAAGTPLVSDVLPAGMIFISGPGCEGVGNSVRCRVDQLLAPGAEVRIPLRVVPGFATYPRAENVAEVHFELDGRVENNRTLNLSAVTLEPLAALNRLRQDFDEIAVRHPDAAPLRQHLNQAGEDLAAGFVEAAVRDLAKFRAAVAVPECGLGPKYIAELDTAGRLTIEALHTPTLQISASEPDQVRISWTGPPGTRLESASKLGRGTDWFSVESETERYQIFLPTSNPRAFFRLVKP